MLKVISRKERGVQMNGELVSRKKLIKVIQRFRVGTKKAVSPRYVKSISGLKKLAQKWRWRWNRKSDKVWKKFRFSTRLNISGLLVQKMRRSFINNKILKDLLMWRYSLKKKNLYFYSVQILRYRLDKLLVERGYVRNIKEARLKIQSGLVILNGLPVFDYNFTINKNDIIQLRNLYNENLLLSIKLPFLVKQRYLG